MNSVIVALATLIVLHNVDGEEVSINPEHVAALMHTRESITGQPSKLVAKGIKCVIIMSSGNIISVVEDCGMVRQAIREAQR